MVMDYSIFKTIISTTNRCELSAAYEMAEFFIGQKHLWYTEEDTSDNPLLLLCELAQIIVNENITIIGTADEYHNLATLYAKNRLSDYACSILERGLVHYSDSPDLLADYLHYGMSCEKFDNCMKYYSQLMFVSKNLWTWRAFMFSIDFLLERINLNHNSISYIEILNLAREYLSHYPQDEQAAFSLSQVYHSYGKFIDEESTLKTALENHNVSPKCALRLADIYFERGNYQDAIVLLNRAIANAIQPQTPINLSYCHLLLALCKIAPLLNMDDNTTLTSTSNISNKDEIISEVYDHAHIAFETNGLNEALSSNLRQTLKLVELNFGVPNPYLDE